MNDGAAAGKRRYQVRRGGAGDAESLVPLRAAFFHDQVGKGLLDVPDLSPGALQASTELILTRPRTFVFLSISEAVTTGYVYGQIRIVPQVKQPRVAIIEELYVDPRRAAVSTAFALVRAIVEGFEVAGVDRIQGRALSSNLKSRRLVEAMGFSPNLVLYEYKFPSR